MGKLAVLIGFFLLVGGGLAGAWLALNEWSPASIGTPAHAGAISNGRPQDCTNVNITVKPQAEQTVTVPLAEGDDVRATFEADGGFGRVDVLLRLVTPLGQQILESPRAENYDFSFSAQVRGTYTLVLDNRYSLYTAKNVALYYCIDRQRAPG
ncbi:MAG: emp24/gp25L/p24 family protein [Dehalococcoidia bacterium]|nr:emp24/gp25L/p24 family protein [Dehalococcoidia bacterium]